MPSGKHNRKSLPKSGDPVPAKTGPPSPPSDVTKDVREKWVELMPLLPSAAMLECDTDVIRQYCETYCRRVKAVTELQGMPLVVEVQNGATMMNPLVKIIQQCDSMLMKLSQRLGLDPLSRQKITSVKNQKASKLEGFTSRNPKLSTPAE